MMTDLPWILASRSPRRAQLLTEAGIAFEQQEPEYDDPATPGDTGQSPARIAMDLAQAKAESLSRHWRDRLILAADTLLVMPDGSLAGTPTTLRQARQMIQRMMGTTHQVVTGVAIILPPEASPPPAVPPPPEASPPPEALPEVLPEVSPAVLPNNPSEKLFLSSLLRLSDTARVTLGEVMESDIEAYLQTFAWRGKAGGYNLFERQAAGWPIKVQGDPTTVVGLPMALLKKEMIKAGLPAGR